EIALTANGNALSRNGRGLGEELIAPGIGRRHAGDKQSKVVEVSPIQRQAFHLRLGYSTGDLTAGRLQDLRFSADHLCFSGTGTTESDRHFERGADTDCK